MPLPQKGVTWGMGWSHGPLVFKPRFCQGQQPPKGHVALIQPQSGFYKKGNLKLFELRKYQGKKKKGIKKGTQC